MPPKRRNINNGDDTGEKKKKSIARPNLFEGLIFCVHQETVAGLSKKAMTKLIQEYGGQVVPSNRNWSFGLVGTVSAFPII